MHLFDKFLRPRLQSPSPSSSTAPPPPHPHPPPPSYTPTAPSVPVPSPALFPPPPPYFSTWDRSPTNNATADDALAGRTWCLAHPLLLPSTITATGPPDPRRAQLLPPTGYRGHITPLAPGIFRINAHNAPDHTLLSYPPLYSPHTTPAPRWVYFEITIPPTTTSFSSSSSSLSSQVPLAIGFAALPYPPFRLPGWHRGSLAVHGDDGHRYVNDDAGGIAFADPFEPGRTYGIGIDFVRPESGAAATVVFTRDGRVVGEWALDEGRDREMFGDGDEGVRGLEGAHDLCAAVGGFGDVACEVVLDPDRWRYRR